MMLGTLYFGLTISIFLFLKAYSAYACDNDEKYVVIGPS
jgi:hypothetical protein